MSGEIEALKAKIASLRHDLTWGPMVLRLNAKQILARCEKELADLISGGSK